MGFSNDDLKRLKEMADIKLNEIPETVNNPVYANRWELLALLARLEAAEKGMESLQIIQAHIPEAYQECEDALKRWRKSCARE